MFGNTPVPGNYHIHAELIAGTEYGTVVVGIGDFIQDHDQRLLPFPQISDESIQGDYTILREIHHLQGHTPVIRGETIQIVSTYPVDRDLMFPCKGDTFLGPGTRFSDQQRPCGLS
jgi:hypothetical protein